MIDNKSERKSKRRREKTKREKEKIKKEVKKREREKKKYTRMPVPLERTIRLIVNMHVIQTLKKKKKALIKDNKK